MRRALLGIALAVALLAACDNDATTDNAEPSPVDVRNDEAWQELWTQAVDEHDEVGQATDERIEAACKQALDTMTRHGDRLTNVSDTVLRQRLGKAVSSLTELYRDCVDDPVVDDAFGRRFLDVTKEGQMVGDRLQELGVHVGGE